MPQTIMQSMPKPDVACSLTGFFLPFTVLTKKVAEISGDDSAFNYGGNL